MTTVSSGQTSAITSGQTSTGWVILSGDAVHFKDNWDNRRVPANNVDKDQTLASMQRLADVMKQYNAQLWINHDKIQSDQQRHAPEYYE